MQSGGLLYVTSYQPISGDSSLSIVDPSTHEVVGSVTDPRLDGAATLVVQGGYAYVTGVQNRIGLTNANRLTIVDVSNPASPAVVGSVQDNVNLYGAYGVQVVGNVAYVAAQGCVPSVCKNPEIGNRLAVVDVSDKAEPRGGRLGRRPDREDRAPATRLRSPATGSTGRRSAPRP